MHTVLRVEDIQQVRNNNRLYEVQLALTNDNDTQLVSLASWIQKELHGSN